MAGALAERGVEPGALVVDAGCGTGRHVRELAARGYRAIGIDRSAELIAQAAGAELVVADLRDWRPPEPAGAVLCRGVLNDLIDDGERAAALRALREMLAPGGVLIADVRDRDASAARYAEPRVTERGAGGVRFRSEMRFEDGLLIAVEQIDDTHAEFRMRPWERDELESGLRAAGFERVEWIEPADAGARDDRIVLSARA